MIINRIDNDGRRISDQNEKLRSTKVCMELTKKYGLYIASGKENVKRERLKGNDKTKYKVEFFCGFQLFGNDKFGVLQCMFGGITVSHTSGQLRHFHPDNLLLQNPLTEHPLIRFQNPARN